MLRVQGIDHVVFNVSDVEKSLAWWQDVLGVPGERVDEWRRGEVFFPSVRIDGTTVVDLFEAPRTGENADHVCLVIEPTDLAELAASGRFDVVDGPSPRWGAQGMGMSLYVKDPDGNTIELRHYGTV